MPNIMNPLCYSRAANISRKTLIYNQYILLSYNKIVIIKSKLSNRFGKYSCSMSIGCFIMTKRPVGRNQRNITCNLHNNHQDRTPCKKCFLEFIEEMYVGGSIFG